MNIDILTDKIWTLWSNYYRDGDKTSQEILDISKADIQEYARQQVDKPKTSGDTVKNWCEICSEEANININVCQSCFDHNIHKH